ncbi:MAG TPA: DUF2283 domain-containing protein [Chloroflexota bacterium]|nr:DUF2283 domain-containing protein [Chloroflexota bacterium]
MKLAYYPDTDTLSITLRPDAPSVESEEIAESIVVDFDADGNVVALEIDNASEKADLDVTQLIGLSNVHVSTATARQPGAPPLETARTA